MSNLTLEPARPADAAAILAIHYDAVHNGPAKDCYPPEVLNDWSPPVGKQRIAAFARGFELSDAIGVIACLDGEPVGFGVFKEPSKMIGAIYVKAIHGGKGIGGNILAHLETLAAGRGIRVLHLASSLNARNFYARHGYEPEKEGYHVLPTGRSMRCIKMKKILKKTLQEPESYHL